MDNMIDLWLQYIVRRKHIAVLDITNITNTAAQPARRYIFYISITILLHIQSPAKLLFRVI